MYYNVLYWQEMWSLRTHWPGFCFTAAVTVTGQALHVVHRTLTTHYIHSHTLSLEYCTEALDPFVYVHVFMLTVLCDKQNVVEDHVFLSLFNL